jgi:hypothetical protein
MPSWTVICRYCGHSFSVSQIGDSLADYYFPAKPKIQAAGISCQCPNCTIKATYDLNELRYDASFAASGNCG